MNCEKCAERLPGIDWPKELDKIKAGILLIPSQLHDLGDLDDDGGEPEYYLSHPKKNIVAGLAAHCAGMAIGIDELLGRDPMRVEQLES